MICAGGHRKGACFVSFDRDDNSWAVIPLCQGDSGGPLTQDGILIGVVSGGDVSEYGYDCDSFVSIQDC